MHPPASAYIKELSREPAGLVGGQEDHDIGHVLGRAASAKRCAGGYDGLLVGREPAGLDWTRSHNIDGDAVLANFDRCGAVSRVLLVISPLDPISFVLVLVFLQAPPEEMASPALEGT
jgi:hypothetical protein